jgi:hypothetical protein
MSDSRKEVIVQNSDVPEILRRLDRGQDVREILSLVNARTIREARNVKNMSDRLNLPYGME